MSCLHDKAPNSKSCSRTTFFKVKSLKEIACKKYKPLRYLRINMTQSFAETIAEVTKLMRSAYQYLCKLANPATKKCNKAGCFQ